MKNTFFSNCVGWDIVMHRGKHCTARQQLCALVLQHLRLQANTQTRHSVDFSWWIGLAKFVSFHPAWRKWLQRSILLRLFVSFLDLSGCLFDTHSANAFHSVMHKTLTVWCWECQFDFQIVTTVVVLFVAKTINLVTFPDISRDIPLKVSFASLRFARRLHSQTAK